jgi:phage gp36-like protein
MAGPITVYADVAQLEALGMRAEALAKILEPAKTIALQTATDLVNGYLARYQLPLMAIGGDLVRATAIIAAYDLLSAKGLNPDQSASDKNVLDRYRDTLAWLKLVAQGTVVPTGIIDSGAGAEVGEPSAGQSRVISAESRGYSVRGTEFAFYRGPFQTG